MNILAATKDQKLFASWFRKGETWYAWFAFLAALFALPMTPEQLVTYHVNRRWIGTPDRHTKGTPLRVGFGR